MPVPLDRTRVVITLGIVAALALAWLWCTSLAPASDSPVAALPFVALLATCFGIVMTPSLARADDRRQTLTVAGLAAGLAILIGVLAYTLGLVPMTLGSLVAEVLGSLLAVVVALYLQTTPQPADAIGSPSRLRQEAPRVASTSPPREPSGTIMTVNEDGFDVGSRLGRYTLENRLAIGGMGEVWRASHDTLIRPAVLKIIRRQPNATKASDDELVERFRREAMVTANLTSPHTVHLYDFGIEGDKSVYIAMELLEALSIAAIVNRFGPMPEERVAFLLRQACHSLIEAHDSGVVHRDLKPDNLLVTRAGRDTDFLKVIDFGLVKELAGSKRRSMTGRQAAVQPLTAFGARPGTPGYMAPEQIDGSVVDQRTDIYALACVAYFALTGLPVFEGHEEAQLMFAHMQIEPDAPSARVGRSLHAGLESVVMRCLAKDPTQRPDTMGAVDQALAALTFETPWNQERAAAWWSEERTKLRTRARESV